MVRTRAARARGEMTPAVNKTVNRGGRGRKTTGRRPLGRVFSDAVPSSLPPQVTVRRGGGAAARSDGLDQSPLRPPSKQTDGNEAPLRSSSPRRGLPAEVRFLPTALEGNESTTASLKKKRDPTISPKRTKQENSVASPQHRNGPIVSPKSATAQEIKLNFARKSAFPINSPAFVQPRPRDTPSGGAISTLGSLVGGLASFFQKNQASQPQSPSKDVRTANIKPDDELELEIDLSEESTEEVTTSETESEYSVESTTESSEGDEEISGEDELEAESKEDAAYTLKLSQKKKSRKKKQGPRFTRSGENRKCRGIDPKMAAEVVAKFRESRADSCIVNAARFNPEDRRKRVPWVPEEESAIVDGVARYGRAWAKILASYSDIFHPRRTDVDLKDKYRNMMAYVAYGDHPLRYFMLVDENHNPIFKPGESRIYRFKNRWPRDVALKAASRNEFYEVGQSHCFIYVRECESDAARETGIPPVVHVYRATRSRVVAPVHLAQVNVRTVWTTEVRKIREERLLNREDVEKVATATRPPSPAKQSPPLNIARLQ